MAAQLEPHTLVVRTEGQVAADLGEGQTALMSVERGSYYSLNEVGGRVWELLSEPRAVTTLCQVVAEEYDVDPEQAERDVSAYVQELLAEGLLRLDDAPAPR